MGVRMLICLAEISNRLQATQSCAKREPQFPIEAVEIETKLVTLGAMESVAALCTDDGARPHEYLLMRWRCARACANFTMTKTNASIDIAIHTHEHTHTYTQKYTQT